MGSCADRATSKVAGGVGSMRGQRAGGRADGRGERADGRGDNRDAREK